MPKTKGCLLAVGIGTGGLILLAGVLVVATVMGIRQDERRSAPTVASVQSAQDIKPVIHVADILGAKGKAIGTVLAQQLGAGATVNYERSYGVMQWVGRQGELTLEVLPDKGRVLSVVVVFKPPVRDWAAALTTVGLDSSIGPTKEAPFQLHWQRAFPAIDEVLGFYAENGKPAIKQLSITPDKAASDLWDRGP